MFSDLKKYIYSKRNYFQEKSYQEHLSRINNMKPVIDNKEPKKHPFNNKKIIEHRARVQSIEKGNMLLLERLAVVIQKSSLDNKLSNYINTFRDFKKKISNRDKKIKLEKINRDNKILLERIIKCKPQLLIK